MKHHRDDGASADDASLGRRVLLCCAVASGLTLLYLLAFFSLDLTPTLRGFLGAFGAIVSFGCSSVPAKHPDVAAMGTFRFQLLVTAGNTASTVTLALLSAAAFDLQGVLALTPFGILGALVLTSVQLAAWPAIHRLGAAAGPGIWCGVGMATSFLWGVLVFGEELRSVASASLAVLLLVAGVGLTAASQGSEEGHRALIPSWLPCCCGWRQQQPAYAKVPTSETGGGGGGGGGSGSAAGITASAGEEEIGKGAAFVVDNDAAAAAAAARHATRTGVLFALLTGVLDGTLMTAFTAYKRRQQRQRREEGAAVAGAAALSQNAEAVSYLLSFGLALPFVAIPPIIAVLRCQARRSNESKADAGAPSSSSSSSPASASASASAAPPLLISSFSAGSVAAGLCSGFLWACGNFGGIHATLGLGQAVGFPLTQVCVLMSAAWGIFGFGEIPSSSGRALFTAASSVVLAGAFLLARQAPR